MIIKKKHHNSMNVDHMKQMNQGDIGLQKYQNIDKNVDGKAQQPIQRKQLVSKKNPSYHEMNKVETRLNSQPSSSLHLQKRINFSSQSAANNLAKQKQVKTLLSVTNISYTNRLKIPSKNNEFKMNPHERFQTQLQTTNMSDDNIEDSQNSFFYKDDDDLQNIVGQTVVNTIPVSPNKQHKLNNELDFFASKNIMPSSQQSQKIIKDTTVEGQAPSITNLLSQPSQLTQENDQKNEIDLSLLQSSQFKCETAAICEENLQINNQQISRKIVNKSLSSINSQRVIQQQQQQQQHQYLEQHQYQPQLQFQNTQQLQQLQEKHQQYEQIQQQQVEKQYKQMQQQVQQSQEQIQQQQPQCKLLQHSQQNIQQNSHQQSIQQQFQQLQPQQLPQQKNNPMLEQQFYQLTQQSQNYSNQSSQQQNKQLQQQKQQYNQGQHKDLQILKQNYLLTQQYAQPSPSKNIGRTLYTEEATENRRDSNQYRMRYNCPLQTNQYNTSRELYNYYDITNYPQKEQKRETINFKENNSNILKRQTLAGDISNNDCLTTNTCSSTNCITHEKNENILGTNNSTINANNNSFSKISKNKNKVNFKNYVFCKSSKTNQNSTKTPNQNNLTNKNKTVNYFTSGKSYLPLAQDSTQIINHSNLSINTNLINNVNTNIINNAYNLVNKNENNIINPHQNYYEFGKNNYLDLNNTFNENRMSNQFVNSRYSLNIDNNLKSNLEHKTNDQIMNTQFNQERNNDDNLSNNFKLYNQNSNMQAASPYSNSKRINKYDLNNIQINGYNVLPNYGKNRHNNSINSNLNSNNNSNYFSNRNLIQNSDQKLHHENVVNPNSSLQNDQLTIKVKNEINSDSANKYLSGNKYLSENKYLSANKSISENILNKNYSIEKQLLSSEENNKFSIKNAFQQAHIEVNKRIKCNCDQNLSENQTCSRAHKWSQILYPGENLDSLKKLYEQIKESRSSIVEQSVIQQINRDIGRTYPHLKFFQPINQQQQNSELKPQESPNQFSMGLEQLSNILYSFAAYEPQIGYVQGINFIAAHFLYHSEEYIAFWLLVSTFERFELRDIYLPSNLKHKSYIFISKLNYLPGLKKHSFILEKILQKIDPQLFNHLNENEIKPEMYITPWLFTQFGMMIPLKYLDMFYQNMILEGWCFFYQFIMSYLLDNKQDILQEDSIEKQPNCK